MLDFEIAGEPLQVTVTSFRNVAWDSFRPNFFMVMTPAALQDYPGTYLNSLYLPDGREDATLELMRQFPAVTVIDLDAILGQVRDVMDKAAFAVQAVFIFTLLAGLAVLWAAVNATRDEREFESAMLRSMGASRRARAGRRGHRVPGHRRAGRGAGDCRRHRCQLLPGHARVRPGLPVQPGSHPGRTRCRARCSWALPACWPRTRSSAHPR